ncbi:MAG: type II secretion system F family protein [Clostridia bacterium]|nr:type II secretion system F family protein [Clostridia bacterium]
MPLYIYKAVTQNGQIVTNRVEEMNRFILLRKLKNNKLMPIKVTQIQMNKRANNSIKKQRKNIERSDSVLKTVRQQEITRSIMSKNKNFSIDTKRKLFNGSKIKNRDIVIFTQNFFLLKKANFNNIHALSTIIETTENPSLRSILEDILLGVEAGESMYSTMEYYTGVFPPIYINIIKVGELSRFVNKSIRAGCKIS